MLKDIAKLLGRLLLYIFLFIAGICIVTGSEVSFNYNKARAESTITGKVKNIMLTGADLYKLIK